jgi:hypothetical protein
MKYRPHWALLGVGAIVVALLFTYPTWRKFLPTRGAASGFPAASDAQRQILSQMGKTPGAAATTYIGMLTVVPAPTNEQPTPVLPDAQIIASAEFGELDAIHTARGSVTLYRSANGDLLLRFDDFAVTNGPDLMVYLCGVAEPKTRDDLGGGGVSEFPVGRLKGSVGNQQFPIPRELTITRYKSVVIYSESLQTIYSYASLQ